MAWLVWFGRFSLVGLVWDVWFGKIWQKPYFRMGVMLCHLSTTKEFLNKARNGIEADWLSNNSPQLIKIDRAG